MMDLSRFFSTSTSRLGDEHYPRLLTSLNDPPLNLTLCGKEQNLLTSTPCIAMVGSRKPSRHAEEIAFHIAHDLAAHGYTIVSGMAYGIDAAVHRGALTAKGFTVAVWGTGINIIYPRGHMKLAQQVAEQGLIVTEFPRNTLAQKYHFPQRNRIISGLSVATIVIEAAVKSGSLITARTALDQGRDVFVVPGMAGVAFTAGSNRLLKQGAGCVESAQDVLEEIEPLLPRYGFQKKPGHFKNSPVNHADNLRIVESRKTPESQTLESQTLSLEEVMVQQSMTVTEATQWIGNLVLKGLAVELPGKRYQLKGLVKNG